MADRTSSTLRRPTARCATLSCASGASAASRPRRPRERWDDWVGDFAWPTGTTPATSHRWLSEHDVSEAGEFLRYRRHGADDFARHLAVPGGAVAERTSRGRPSRNSRLQGRETPVLTGEDAGSCSPTSVCRCSAEEAAARVEWAGQMVAWLQAPPATRGADAAQGGRVMPEACRWCRVDTYRLGRCPRCGEPAEPQARWRPPQQTEPTSTYRAAPRRRARCRSRFRRRQRLTSCARSWDDRAACAPEPAAQELLASVLTRRDRLTAIGFACGWERHRRTSPGTCGHAPGAPSRCAVGERWTWRAEVAGETSSTATCSPTTRRRACRGGRPGCRAGCAEVRERAPGSRGRRPCTERSREPRPVSGGAFEVVGPDGRVVSRVERPADRVRWRPAVRRVRHLRDAARRRQTFTVRPARPWWRGPGCRCAGGAGPGATSPGGASAVASPSAARAGPGLRARTGWPGHLLLVAGSGTLSVADLVALVSPRTSDDV